MTLGEIIRQENRHSDRIYCLLFSNWVW